MVDKPKTLNEALDNVQESWYQFTRPWRVLIEWIYYRVTRKPLVKVKLIGGPFHNEWVEDPGYDILCKYWGRLEGWYVRDKKHLDYFVYTLVADLTHD